MGWSNGKTNVCGHVQLASCSRGGGRRVLHGGLYLQLVIKWVHALSEAVKEADMMTAFGKPIHS